MQDPLRLERPREEVLGSIRAMVDVWQALAASAGDVAHAKRAIFQAYVAEGFTEAQALELIKTI